MKKLAIIVFAAFAISALAADTQVKGYLVDLDCARDEGQRPDFGIKHSKNCLQMPDCQDAGFGVLTDDKKVIRFDKAGNVEAKKFITTMTKTTDIKVTVTGSVDGDQMTVTTIQMQ